MEKTVNYEYQTNTFQAPTHLGSQAKEKNGVCGIRWLGKKLQQLLLLLLFPTFITGRDLAVTDF